MAEVVRWRCPTERPTVRLLPALYKLAIRYALLLLLLDFDRAGPEEAAEHAGTLLAI